MKSNSPLVKKISRAKTSLTTPAAFLDLVLCVQEVEPDMNQAIQFDATRWIVDAFTAGIFPRVNANGDLSLNVIDATPEDTKTLLARLSGHSEDVILQMPRPDSDALYLN